MWIQSLEYFDSSFGSSNIAIKTCLAHIHKRPSIEREQYYTSSEVLSLPLCTLPGVVTLLSVHWALIVVIKKMTHRHIVQTPARWRQFFEFSPWLFVSSTKSRTRLLNRILFPTLAVLVETRKPMWILIAFSTGWPQSRRAILSSALQYWDYRYVPLIMGISSTLTAFKLWCALAFS